jgi:hypothetical protein
MAPSASPDMLNLPTRVSFTTSAEESRPTTASHASRRAFSAGITARTWSSRNSIEAMMMSPRAMSARQASSAAVSPAHSSAACTISSSPGSSFFRLPAARSAAPDR